jgi:hypothetical protein
VDQVTQKRGRAQRATVLAAVEAAVNAVDPEGLLAGGAPADEYDPEVKDLAKRILAGSELNRQLVQTVWSHWFGVPSRLTDVAADKLVDLINDRLSE